MKTILIIASVAILGGSLLWLAPHDLLAADTKSTSPEILYYTCPMHPSVKADKPGDCPICGMHLAPIYGKPGGVGTNAPPAATGTNAPAARRTGCCGGEGCR